MIEKNKKQFVQNTIPFVHELLFLCKVCDMMKYVKIRSMQILTK